jgi:predicted ATPase
MIRFARFRNFKGLQDFTVSLRRTNVLVGTNNAGKSTVLDGFRALEGALKFAPTATAGNHRRGGNLGDMNYQRAQYL